uniref:Uncharacterized protein n=1 Tax=Noccaea caerulescens TaxID=107243 RepID=A0A1J3F633_NOCCA
MTLHQLRDSLLSSTKLETRKKVVENLTRRGKMNLDIIKMARFLASPPKNGFAVYNPLAQNKWREVSMPWEGRFLSSISKKSYYCVKKTGALF